MADIITLDDVSVVFEHGGRLVEAVSHANVHVEEGEIFGIVGFSGAGKSTLVRTINLLERPTSGRVVIDGRDVTTLRGAALRELRSGIGFVFQSFNLIDNVTVAQNIAFALKAAHVPKAQRRPRIEELLRLVGLEEKIDSYPSQLSGGQKQRVSIARALANHPRILLCDEATSALDPKSTNTILKLLRDINRETGVTLVVITHSMDVVEKICRNVAVLEAGRVVEQGSVEQVFADPRADATRVLLGKVEWDA